MDRRSFIAAMAAGALGARGAAAAGRGYVDLMPGYFRVFDDAADLTPQGRAQAVMDRFVTPHLDLYQHAGLKNLDPDRIARALAKTAPMLPRMRALHHEFPRLFVANQRQFAKAFLDFSSTASPVYLMPSFLRFDGHLEPNGKVLPLYLGLDGAVFYHGVKGDLGVLLAHELFHCFHAQVSPGIAFDPESPLWKSLWSEGLATYVSEKLNPDASRLHVLLDAEDLERRGDDFVRPWAKRLVERFGSNDDEAAKALFSAGYKGPEPARGGYLVGLLVARKLGEGRSLRQLAGLTSEEAEPLVRAELTRLVG